MEHKPIEKEAVIYKIYTSINSADTCRDKDCITTKNIGCFETKDKALDIAKKHIVSSFSDKNTPLIKTSNGYIALDICSYGETLIIEEIKLK